MRLLLPELCRNALPSLVTGGAVVCIDNVFDVAGTWWFAIIIIATAMAVTKVDTMIRKGVR